MSENNLTQEFSELFKKHLPETTAGVLKQRLQEFEKTEKEHIELKKNYETIVKHNAELQSLKLRDEAIKEERKDLEIAKAEVVQEKRDLASNRRIFELEVRLESEKANSIFAREVCNSLVRNTVYRENILKSTEDLHRDGYGTTLTRDFRNDSEETTKTTE